MHPRAWTAKGPTRGDSVKTFKHRPAAQVGKQHPSCWELSCSLREPQDARWPFSETLRPTLQRSPE